MAQTFMEDPEKKFKETKSKVVPTSPGINVMKGSVPTHQSQTDSNAADKRHQHATKQGKTTLTPGVVAKVKSKLANEKQVSDPPAPKMTTGPGYDDKTGIRRVG